MQQRAQMPSARADPQSRPRSLATLAVGFGLLQGLGACVLNDRLDPALEVPKNYRAAHLASEAALPPHALLPCSRTSGSIHYTPLLYCNNTHSDTSSYAFNVHSIC